MGGRNIASERVRLGMTQQELANVIGVTPNTVSNWELGRFEPTSSKLKQLSELFKCSVDYLLGSSNERFGSFKEC